MDKPPTALKHKEMKKMVRSKKKLRREIGLILAEAESPLYSGQIADRIANRGVASRTVNFSINIIAGALRGAHGVEVVYPQGTRMRGAAIQYKMTDKNAFDKWVNK